MASASDVRLAKFNRMNAAFFLAHTHSRYIGRDWSSCEQKPERYTVNGVYHQAIAFLRESDLNIENGIPRDRAETFLQNVEQFTKKCTNPDSQKKLEQIRLLIHGQWTDNHEVKRICCLKKPNPSERAFLENYLCLLAFERKFLLKLQDRLFYERHYLEQLLKAIDNGIKVVPLLENETVRWIPCADEMWSQWNPNSEEELCEFAKRKLDEKDIDPRCANEVDYILDSIELHLLHLQLKSYTKQFSEQFEKGMTHVNLISESKSISPALVVSLKRFLQLMKECSELEVEIRQMMAGPAKKNVIFQSVYFHAIKFDLQR